MHWLRNSENSTLLRDSLRSNDACAASPRAAAASQEATHIKGGAASLDSSGGESITWPGLRCFEPSGFRGDTWVDYDQQYARGGCGLP